MPYTSEGLAVLPDKVGDEEVFILRPPAIVDSIEEEVRLQIYALDYSHRLHAKVHPTKELHPDRRLVCSDNVLYNSPSCYMEQIYYNNITDFFSIQYTFKSLSITWIYSSTIQCNVM
eukprot:scaffold222412_cov59-Attheya_sp.AAC.1